MSIRIAISIGDFNGIGPEIILKTLSKSDLSTATPVILGTRPVIEYYHERLGLELDINYASQSEELKEQKINLLESFNSHDPAITPGTFSTESGQCAMWAVETGIRLCMDQETDALVTAPISKEAVNKAGYNIPGHTEFLAEKTGSEEFMMLLVHEKLRVGLASIHIPLKRVPVSISKETVGHYLGIMNRSLNNDFGIPAPDIAVLGLNPHAGDGGVIGNEEIEIISPALENARKTGIKVQGPYPADSFFGNRRYEDFDGILAMYHDQGLIPFKTLSFGSGVNFTAGLPIIRTSPDHGTAFDIAGQNEADPSSFEEAYNLAIGMAANRKKVSPQDG